MAVLKGLLEKLVALYVRLSRDDENQGDSNIIAHQKSYLEEFARSKGFKRLQHFTDDGYSGVHFNRPGFSAMLAEIEAGNVGTVICKDMSRLGRNYLQVGFYTEIFFQQKNGRRRAHRLPSAEDRHPFQLYRVLSASRAGGFRGTAYRGYRIPPA